MNPVMLVIVRLTPESATCRILDTPRCAPPVPIGGNLTMTLDELSRLLGTRDEFRAGDAFDLDIKATKRAP